VSSDFVINTEKKNIRPIYRLLVFEYGQTATGPLCLQQNYIHVIERPKVPTGACTTLHRHTSPSHCNWPVMWMLDDVFALLYPWRWSYLRRVIQRWVIEHSRCQLHGHGTPCYLTLELHRHSPRSDRSSNTFSAVIPWWVTGDSVTVTVI